MKDRWIEKAVSQRDLRLRVGAAHPPTLCFGTRPGTSVCAGNIYLQVVIGKWSSGIAQIVPVAADDKDTDNTAASKAAAQVKMLATRHRLVTDVRRRVGFTTSIGVRSGGM